MLSFGLNGLGAETCRDFFITAQESTLFSALVGSCGGFKKTHGTNNIK
jgi:hypothetical protein